MAKGTKNGVGQKGVLKYKKKGIKTEVYRGKKCWPTMSEAAKALGVHANTVRNMVARKDLKSYAPKGRGKGLPVLVQIPG